MAKRDTVVREKKRPLLLTDELSHVQVLWGQFLCGKAQMVLREGSVERMGQRCTMEKGTQKQTVHRRGEGDMATQVRAL